MGRVYRSKKTKPNTIKNGCKFSLDLERVKSRSSSVTDGRSRIRINNIKIQAKNQLAVLNIIENYLMLLMVKLADNDCICKY